MTYRNQNYMTNVALKEQADNAQKYSNNDDDIEEKHKYGFISYGDEEKEIQWGEGTVQETGVTENGYTEVKILTNSTDQSFVGQLVYITSDAKTDGTVYPLYSDAGETELNIYVTISEL